VVDIPSYLFSAKKKPGFWGLGQEAAITIKTCRGEAMPEGLYASPLQKYQLTHPLPPHPLPPHPLPIR
jgi:hypothetical protein